MKALRRCLALLCLLALAAGLTGCGPVAGAGRPDPSAAVLAIADREIGRLADPSAENLIGMYTTEPQVTEICRNWLRTLRTGAVTTRLWAIPEGHTAAPDTAVNPDDPTGGLSLLLQSRTNALGSAYIAAQAVLQSLAEAGGYCYDWDRGKYPAYVAAKSVGGRLCALVFCSFNATGAIETSVFPVLAADLSDPALLRLDAALLLLPSLAVPDYTAAEMKTFLAEMVPVRRRTDSAREVALSMAKRIAEKADPESLALIGVPDEIFEMCRSCRVFGAEPALVLRVSLPERARLTEFLGTALPAEVSDARVASALPLLLNGMLLGNEHLAAASVMQTRTAISGLNFDREIIWIICGDLSAPLICAVSMIRNANGCHDVAAVPLYLDADTAARLLKYVVGDTLDLGAAVAGE